MRNHDKIYLNGQWVAPGGSETIEVYNAATEEVMGSVPAATAEDADKAVKAARAAFPGWSATSREHRAELLTKVHEGIVARTDEIAETVTGEVGMPLKLSKMIQAGNPALQFKQAAGLLSSFDFEETIGNTRVLREPIGVAVCITPWNFPLNQVGVKVSPALAAGCTVVLKPSEVAPLSVYILADIIDQAGFPDGVFNMVTGLGPVVGEPMAAHPETDMVSFTGSTAAGRRVSEVAAGTVKRVSLELGGKSAAIILDDADLAKAVKGAVAACFLNSGQTCVAQTRMLVPEGSYEEAKRLVAEAVGGWTVGDPMVEGTRLGPVASKTQWERVEGYIQKGIDEGAELVLGGTGKPDGLDRGYFVRPTVFGRVDPDATIAQNEIFGPVLSILTYTDDDDAIAIANNSIYGLSGGVWSSDEDHAMDVARRLRTGMVDINGGRFNPEAPFGGYKQSGNGREWGRFGLEEFLETKAIQL
ncbi:MAG: aldehyde dehydrogenase family protein [Rhodospirillales bacterium]|jgi:betaine-aldehyde dehydrogenase|nr:aldehyde dehydrogenase family protein [Rhodospirillales bacterium]